MSHISFSSSGCWYKPMASWLRWVTESLERWFQLLMSAETFHSPLASMCSTKPVSEHWHTRFYIAVLYLQFFLLGFSQSQSHADRVVNLTWPLDFYCFGELELGPGPALAQKLAPNVLAWHVGREYSYCRASELTDCQVSGFVYSWFLENTEKMKAL